MVFGLLKSPIAKVPRNDQAFEFDAHILIYQASQLVSHEYILHATPQVFSERMAVLEAQSQVSVIYETAGALTHIACSLPQVEGQTNIHTESLQEWQRRDPQAVAQVTGQYLDDADDSDLSLWRI